MRSWFVSVHRFITYSYYRFLLGASSVSFVRARETDGQTASVGDIKLILLVHDLL